MTERDLGHQELELPRKIPMHNLPIPDIADQLRGILGTTMLGHAINEDPEKIRPVALNLAKMPEETETTLRQLAEVTDIFLEKENDSHEMVRVMMAGAVFKEDRSVIDLFHEGEGEHAVRVAPDLFQD